MKVSYALLKKKRACKVALVRWVDLFGEVDEVEITSELCELHGSKFDLNWAAERLMSLPQKRDYEKRMLAIKDEFHELNEALRQEEKSFLDPLRQLYQRQRNDIMERHLRPTYVARWKTEAELHKLRRREWHLTSRLKREQEWHLMWQSRRLARIAALMIKDYAKYEPRYKDERDKFISIQDKYHNKTNEALKALDDQHRAIKSRLRVIEGQAQDAAYAEIEPVTEIFKADMAKREATLNLENRRRTIANARKREELLAFFEATQVS